MGLFGSFRRRRGADGHYYRLIGDIFGIRPGNVELYKLALVHRSVSVFLPGGRAVNNERLEFLGDAVLETIVSDYLFIEFPDMNEGELTQMRSKIVSRSALNDLCVRIGLAPHIMSNAGGAFSQKHLFGDAMEAMIGAIYLDKGYDCTNRVIINNILGRHLDLATVNSTETDFKSRLIEWCQKSKHTIRFETGFDEGANARHPMFRSVALIDDMQVGYGLGTSKKEAEQRAACSVSQALSDEAGDSVLDMLDQTIGDAPPAGRTHGRGHGRR